MSYHIILDNASLANRLFQINLPQVGSYVTWSKLPILGMVIPPLVGNPYNGYINPYYWVDDHSPLHGNNGSLDPSTYGIFENCHPVTVPKRKDKPQRKTPRGGTKIKT